MLALALVSGACSDVQHRVDLDLDPETFAIVAVLEGEALEVTRIDDETSARIRFPPGSHMLVWRFDAEDFVDVRGLPVDAATFSELEVTTNPNVGCGRCTYEAIEAPQRVAPGDVCGLPRFAEAEIFQNSGGPTSLVDSALEASVAARVFLAWPGACSCDDAPLRSRPDVELVQVDSGEPNVATRAGRLLPDGTVIGLTPGHLVAIDPSGEIRQGPTTPEGYIRALLDTDDGILVAFEDRDPTRDGTNYRLITREPRAEVVMGLPQMQTRALVRGADGAVYVGGFIQRGDVVGHAIFRCTAQNSTTYTCVEESTASGTCGDDLFPFTGGVTTTSTNATTVLLGERGQLYVRSAADAAWRCHIGLARFAYRLNGNLFTHAFIDDYAIQKDGRFYVCSTGERSTGPNSRHVTGVVWSFDLGDVERFEDLPTTLDVIEEGSSLSLCTTLSPAPNANFVRTVWGFGDFVVDIEHGRDPIQYGRIGQPWDEGAEAELLTEVADPVLDYIEAGDWAVAVTAARWIYRRAPGETTFSPIYTSREPRRGVMSAFAATEPNTIVAFGSGVHRYRQASPRPTREPITIEGYPPARDSHADVAIADSGAPNRVVVATHRAERWRCFFRGTPRVPCLPPASPTEVQVQLVDLETRSVVGSVSPGSQSFVAGAALGGGVFVFLDAGGRVFAMIDRAFVELEMEWDDPTTDATEIAPPVVGWDDLDGRDGVAWLVGRGTLGRIAWRPGRKLVVEGYWHDHLGAPWTSGDELETIPTSIETWCADRAVITGVQWSTGVTDTTGLRPWTLGEDPRCGSGLGLCPFPEPEADELRFRSFSKPFAWVRPINSLRFEDGTLLFLYDDASVEPRVSPRLLLPFSFVGGAAVSGDLVLVGGEGERVVAVVVPK